MALSNMKLYLFDFCEFGKNGSTVYDASLKPRFDTVDTFLKRKVNLMKPLYISFSGSTNRLISFVKRLWNFLSLRFQFLIGRFRIMDSIVVMQYPLYSLEHRDFNYVMKYFKQRNNRVVFLVHDLNSIRYYDEHLNNDELMFQYADLCVLHSTAMIEKSESLYPNAKYLALEFFDYLLKYTINPQEDLRNIRLIFAGNLRKSKFLEKIDECGFNKHFQLYLYGIYNDGLKCSDNIIYKGKFSPDSIHEIEGNWGLVWDGDSCETCSGDLGEYLRFNAPFKFSLYLAANRPVIVWKHSAMAEYVIKYNLGIVVNSINEIPYVIGDMSDNQLHKILESVAKVSAEVRNGYKLTNVINKIATFFEPSSYGK